MIFVAVCGTTSAGANVVTSITDTPGTVFTRVTSLGSAALICELWSGQAAGTNASNVIKVNVSPNNLFSFATAAYSGASSSLGASTTNSGTATVTDTITGTLAATNDFLIAAIAVGGTATTGNYFTASVGNLEAQGDTSAGAANRPSAIGDNTGALSTTFTVTTAATHNFTACAVDLKPAAVSAFFQHSGPLRLQRFNRRR